MGFTPFGGTGLELQETTGPSGFTLVNGTPNVLTWTAPNDGQMHRCMVIANLDVTSALTGGAINVGWTSPGGNPASLSVIGANGTHTVHAAGTIDFLIQAGSTLTLSQGSAVTAGAAVLYAEIWGS